MARVPLLAGSGLAVLNVPDDAVVLRPPPPGSVVAEAVSVGFVLSIFTGPKVTAVA